MKTRRLSEIDLARFAAIPKGPALDAALRGYNAGGGSWSYDPVRASKADILGATTPMLGALPPLPWDRIARQIERACNRGEAQVKSNVEVGKLLHDEARQRGWKAVKEPMGRLPIGLGETVRYWSDVVVQDDAGLFVPFFDHRREHGIATGAARQVVHSMQHLWVRERNPDLAGARLALVQFPSDEDGRRVLIRFHSEADLLPFDELDFRVRDVYEAWARVSAEKAKDARRTGTGDATPFGF